MRKTLEVDLSDTPHFDLEQSVCDLYLSGLSVYAIERRLHLSRGIINRTLDRCSVQLRERCSSVNLKPQILADYVGGLTYSKIAKKYNLSIYHVGNVIRASNVLRRTPKKEFYEKRRSEVKKLYDEGLNYGQIARKLGVKVGVIENIIYRTGYSNRNTQQNTIKNVVEIIKMFYRGYSTTKIQKLLKLRSTSSVRTIIAKYNLRAEIKK